MYITFFTSLLALLFLRRAYVFYQSKKRMEDYESVDAALLASLNDGDHI